jgi:hypothetical protein
MKLVRKDNHDIAIIGTLESVLGVAGISGGERKPDGSIDVWYDGGTNVNWDSQETVLGPNRERTFVDEDGESVLESNVELVEDGDEVEEEI